MKKKILLLCVLCITVICVNAKQKKHEEKHYRLDSNGEVVKNVDKTENSKPKAVPTQTPYKPLIFTFKTVSGMRKMNEKVEVTNKAFAPEFVSAVEKDSEFIVIVSNLNDEHKTSFCLHFKGDKENICIDNTSLNEVLTNSDEYDTSNVESLKQDFTE